MDEKMDESTSTNSFQYFQQLCKFCCICKQQLFADSNPYLLPCLHTSCGTCMDDFKAFEEESKAAGTDRTPQSTSNQKSEKDQYPTCEQCKEPFKASDCILNIFLLNYFADQKKGIRVTESEKTGKEASDNEVDWDSYVSCASCEDKTDFAAYCKDCEGAICGTCFKQHSTMKAFRKHEPVERNCDEKKTIENFMKKFMNCSKHEKEQYTLYCLMCETVTCKECLIQFHKDHRWENIDEMKKSFIREIDLNRRSISEKRELVESSLRALEQRREQLNKQQKLIRNDIVNCANSLKQAVNDLSQSLFEELQRHCDKRKSEYTKSQENLKSTKESLQFVEHFLNDVVDTSYPVGLLYTKKLIQSQISNLLQKQCLNPNPQEDFELKLTPSMAVFRLENMIKTAWSITSSKNGQNLITATENNVGGERISQKRNSDDIEIISSVPAKRPPPHTPLAACKQCVENVPFTQCTTSASLSYTASVPQTVPNNYPMHTNPLMASNNATAAYPVMFAGTQPLITHINQIQSSGASNTNNSRSMCPPNVTLQQPPRYSTIHQPVPNQSLLQRATVPQAIHTSQSTLSIPNIIFTNMTNGLYETYQQPPRSQVNYQPQPNQLQSQTLTMNSRRDNRVNSLRTTPIGSESTPQHHPQSAQLPHILSQRVISQNPVPQINNNIQAKQVPHPNIVQPKTVPNVQAILRELQRSPVSQTATTAKQKLADQKKAHQQTVQLVTLLPPTESENSNVRQVTQTQPPQDASSKPNENGTTSGSQLHNLLNAPIVGTTVTNCQIYPPAANGQQSQSTSRQTSSSTNTSTSASTNTSTSTAVTASSTTMTMDLSKKRSDSAAALVKPIEKTHMQIQSPPSPIIAKNVETHSRNESVTSTVNSESENGSVSSSTLEINSNGIKMKISKRKPEVATEVVSTTENGYNITFTPSTNGLSSDTEIMQESTADIEDDEETENDEYCSVCKDGGELICCESCPRAFHMQCHIPVLRTIPNMSWTCQLCTRPDVNAMPNEVRRSVGPNASQVNEIACQRILLEIYCMKESEVMRKESSRNNLKMIKDNLENKSNYTEQDFIRDMNSLFRGFYSEHKYHNDIYENAIILEKQFKHLVETYLPQHKSMVKTKIWEIGPNNRLKKTRTS